MILVTGASGLVGREVAKALASRSAPYRLALREPKGEADAVRFDFDDPASFGPALAGIGAIFLLRPPAMARPSFRALP